MARKRSAQLSDPPTCQAALTEDCVQHNIRTLERRRELLDVRQNRYAKVTRLRHEAGIQVLGAPFGVVQRWLICKVVQVSCGYQAVAALALALGGMQRR